MFGLVSLYLEIIPILARFRDGEQRPNVSRIFKQSNCESRPYFHIPVLQLWADTVFSNTLMYVEAVFSNSQIVSRGRIFTLFNCQSRQYFHMLQNT